MQNKLKGKRGEDLAARYLIKQGYEVSQRNWTCRWGEIDLVAKEGSSLVFVEVKYRSSDKFGYSYQAVNPIKIKSLKRSIRRYIYLYRLFDQAYRLDVVCFRLEKGRIRVRHYISVFS